MLRRENELSIPLVKSTKFISAKKWIFSKFPTCLKNVKSSFYPFSFRRKHWLLIAFLVGFTSTSSILVYLVFIRRKFFNDSILKPKSHRTLNLQTFRDLKDLRICCSTVGTLFSVKSSSESTFHDNLNTTPSNIVSDQQFYDIIPSGIGAILRLIPQNDVFLLTQVNCVEEEREVMRLLEETGILWAGLDPAKVLFCSTVQGRTHIAKQLEVQLYIDDSFEVIDALKDFLPRLLYITPFPSEPHSKLHSLKHITTVRDVGEFLTLFPSSRNLE